MVMSDGYTEWGSRIVAARQSAMWPSYLRHFSRQRKMSVCFMKWKGWGRGRKVVGGCFEETANSAEPRVFVQVLMQKFNSRQKYAGMPELMLARGEYSTPLWEWDKSPLYKLSLQIDGHGAGPFMGFIYSRGQDRVYTLRRNDFAKQ